MSRARRYTRRILVLGLYAGAAAVLYLIVAPLLPERGTDGEAAQARAIARPKSVPRVVPEWAWTLSAWQARPVDKRGRRPKAAPRHVPAWYWDWRSWRGGTAAS